MLGKAGLPGFGVPLCQVGQRESWDCLGSTGGEGGRKQQRVTQRAWERVCRQSLLRAERGNERQAGEWCCQ